MAAIQKVYTLEDLQRQFPNRKGSITQELVDMINNSQNEPEFQGESLLQTMVTYESILNNTRAGMHEYARAVKFCAYILTMDDNYTEAYKKVFFDREFVQNRMHLPTDTSQYKELTSAASRYRQSKLVVDILTASQAPLHIMFGGERVRAIMVLATVMTTSKFDRDKINAAKELLAATKGPETSKIELDMGYSASAMSMQQQLNNQLAQIALNQKMMLEGGGKLEDVQRVNVKLGKVEEAEYDAE